MEVSGEGAGDAYYAKWAMLCREVNADASKSRLLRKRHYAFDHCQTMDGFLVSDPAGSLHEAGKRRGRTFRPSHAHAHGECDFSFTHSWGNGPAILKTLQAYSNPRAAASFSQALMSSLPLARTGICSTRTRRLGIQRAGTPCSNKV